jgi:hypothetical protein
LLQNLKGEDGWACREVENLWKSRGRERDRGGEDVGKSIKGRRKQLRAAVSAVVDTDHLYMPVISCASRPELLRVTGTTCSPSMHAAWCME